MPARNLDVETWRASRRCTELELETPIVVALPSARLIRESGIGPKVNQVEHHPRMPHA